MKRQLGRSCVESPPHNSGINPLAFTKTGTLLYLSSVLVFCFVGCSGGGGNGGAGGGNGGGAPQASTVTVNFAPLGIPPTPVTAVAVQTGTGTFAAVSLQNGQFTFSVAAGVSKYAFAYQCGLPVDPPGEGVSDSNEYVIEATTQDGMSVTADCSGAVSFGSAASEVGMETGNVDATAVPNVFFVSIFGKQGSHTDVLTQGPFSVSLPSGTQDIVFRATNSQTQAVKILRGQVVPGAVNGGNTVTFGPEDQAGGEGLDFSNVPAGNLIFEKSIVEFNTANGTSFVIDLAPLGGGGHFYPTVPSAAVQKGDYYAYGGVASASTQSSVQSVGSLQAVENGGLGFIVNLPDVWFSSNPSNLGPPIVFTFDYPGFSGIPVIMQKAEVDWTPDGHLSQSIAVIASANFQNGGNTVSIPDLSMAGQPFFKCCKTGSGAVASATILVANFPVTAFPALPQRPQDPSAVFNMAVPPGGFIGFVQTETGFAPPQ